MALEIKSGLGLTNMNGISTDDDRTCALNDMNCLENQAPKSFALTDMNAVGKDDDTSCSLSDMNCTGDQEEK